MASRPDIIDRNGEVLATDIRTVSLFAEPNKIVDADEAVEKLRDGAARSRLTRHLPQAVGQDFAFRLAASPADAEAAEPDPRARHSRHRLPAGKAPLLSGRRDRLAYPRLRQYRQPRRRRHGEIYRRPGPCRSCRRRHDQQCSRWSRSGCRSISASRRSSETSWPTQSQNFGAKGAGAVVLECQTGEVLGHGIRAGLRSEQSERGRCRRLAEPHVERHVRNGLDLQDLHDGDGARFGQGDATRRLRRQRADRTSAASPSTTSTASAAC